MVGNLQIFLGPETINQYAHFLKSMPKLLWSARVGLLACVAVHILTAISSGRGQQKGPRGATVFVGLTLQSQLCFTDNGMERRHCPELYRLPPCALHGRLDQR